MKKKIVNGICKKCTTTSVRFYTTFTPQYIYIYIFNENDSEMFCFKSYIFIVY